MKTVFKTIAFAAVAAAAITACNKEREVVAPFDEQEQVFTFAIGNGSSETRSILGKDENGRFVQFDSDDTGYQKGIGSIAPNAQGFSSVTPASGDTPATFSIYTKGVSVNDKITVWYPYRSKQTDAKSVELVIPSEQNHKAGNAFDMMAMPMVTKQITVTADMVSATTGDNTPIATINFANLGSLLNFKVFSKNTTYSGEKVKSITFNAKNESGTADAIIGGTFSMDLESVDPDSESTMGIPSFTTGVSSIVTKPYADAAIGTTQSTALDLYMVIAPGTYSGTIMVKTDAAEYTYTLSAKTFVRSGIKAFGLDLASQNAARVEVQPEIDYVTLPWSYPSDWSDENLSATSAGLSAIAGVTASGLGTDYAEGNIPYQIKLDGTGDYINVKTNSAIGVVSIRVKMIGGANTSTITVNESVDGTTWTKVQDLAISGAQNDVLTLSTTTAFQSSSRMVQLYFTKGSNVGLGGISIAEVDNTTWNLSSIAVANPPTKTEYLIGEAFDPTGMVVTANYVDAEDETHTKLNIPITGYTFAPSSALSASDNTITISYTEGTVTKTATQTITVSKPPVIDTDYYELVTSTVSEGKYLIVFDDNKAHATKDGKDLAATTDVLTITADGKIVKTQSLASSLTAAEVTISASGSILLPSGSYLAVGNNACVESNTATAFTFTYSSTQNGMVIKGSTGSYIDRILYKNGTTGWRFYADKTVSGGGLTSGYALPNLYKLVEIGGETTVVATPTFSVSQGTYSSTQSVEIQCETEGATIYYTLDNTTPDDTKTAYTSALTISTTTTVKAIAIKDGVSSEVATATYTIASGSVTVSMTTFESISGSVNGDSNVSYEAAQGTASTAPAIYDGVLRIYQGGGLLTITANNNKKIIGVTIGSAMSTTVAVSIDGGSFGSNHDLDADGTYTESNLDATTVVFKCNGADKNHRLYLNSLSVTYN